MDGSSLLTRGTRVCCRVALENTQVHPRLRGELRDGSSSRKWLYGSSPLTRGTLSQKILGIKHLTVHPRLRGNSLLMLACNVLIPVHPAYAGNSSTSHITKGDSSVHPRLRGELMRVCYMIEITFGSSPLTRGTHLKWLQHYTNRLTAKLLKNISKQDKATKDTISFL